MNEVELKIDRGLALRAAREKKGLTAQQLVDKAREHSKGAFQLSKAAIYAYEAGRVCIPAETARHLAPVLGIPLSQLLIESSAEPAPLERVLLGSTATKSAEHATIEAGSSSLEIELTVRPSGQSHQSIVSHRWSLMFDPKKKQLVLRGHGGAPPQNVRIARLAAEGEAVLLQQPDLRDTTRRVVAENPFRILLDQDGILPLSDDEPGLILRLEEPILAGELRSWLIREPAEPEASSAPDPEEASALETDVVQPSHVHVPKDVVQELNDFLPETTSRRLVALWEESLGHLDRYLQSPTIKRIQDPYRRALIETLAHISLKKSHDHAADVVDQLVRLAGHDPTRLSAALYLQARQRWYVKDIPEAIAAFERSLELSRQDDNRVRAAQCLVYLARVGVDYADQLRVKPEDMVQEALELAQVLERKDIELLARRAELMRLQRENNIEAAIALADQILSEGRVYGELGGEAANILDSIRVNLGVSLRRLGTEVARQEAEAHYEEGIARGRADSHAGMCSYLIADLYIDRLLDALSEAAQHRAAGKMEEATTASRRAEECRKTAMDKCERSHSLLERSGDVAALLKVSRRLLFLRNLPLALPPDSQAAVDELAVREHQISSVLVGMPPLTARRAYDPATPKLDRIALQDLLNHVFVTRLLRLDQHAAIPQVQLVDYIRPGSLLCIPWVVGDSLVVRLFEDHPGQQLIANRGWFTVRNYTSEVRPQFQKWLDSKEQDQLPKMRDELYDQIQRRVDTIEPIANVAFQNVVVLAPPTNADWLCPIEWLLTSQLAADLPNKPLIELARNALLYATSRRAPFPAGEVQVSPDEIEVFASTQVAAHPDRPDATIYDLVREELSVQIKPLPKRKKRSARSKGLVVFAHADAEGELYENLSAWDFGGTEAVVLLFCASAQHRVARGPFADGLALQIQQRLGEKGLVIGSRIPVSLSEALSLARVLFHESSRQRPMADIVTGYLQQHRSSNPFEVPWAML